MGRPRKVEDEQMYAAIKEVDESENRLTPGAVRALLGAGDIGRIEKCIDIYHRKLAESTALKKQEALRELPDELKDLLDKTSRVHVDNLKNDFVAINHFAQEDANKRVIEVEKEKSLLVKRFKDENEDLRQVIQESDQTIEELQEALEQANEASALLQSRLDNRDKEFQDLLERSIKHFADSELAATVNEIKQHLFRENVELPEQV
jgi:uncharacterized phage infection (PIP) family protein YhgE